MDRLTAMETFVCVVESGSFSGGARLLNVGQPAVSKSIAQLEERLGVRLLVRSTRGLLPTQAGDVFYERAKRAIEEADEAERAAKGSAASLSGRLRVSAATTFARLHIVPHLATFLDMHPDLTIDVVLSDENIDLLANGVDVSLRMGKLNDSGMTARKIAQGRRQVIGTPRYFERYGEPLHPAELVSHQAIVHSQGVGGDSWSFNRDNAETSVAVSGRLCVTAAEGVRAAVLAHMGIVVASEWMFRPELISGEVQTVLSGWELPLVDLWAVFPTGRLASAKAKAFVSFVETVMNGVADGTSPTPQDS